MSRDLTLPARLQRFEVPVIEVRGWETRGNDDGHFNPRGALRHATVSNPPRVVPSLNTVINGRPGLPGPHYNVLGSRDHQALVIASGKSNNAGSGGWKGLDSNYEVLAFSFEHTNIASTESFDEADFEFTCRCMAALAYGKFGAEMLCDHWEWTRRKIDLLKGVPLASSDKMRARVADLLRLGGVKPMPIEDALPVFPGFTIHEGHGYPNSTSERIEKAVVQWKYALAALGYKVSMAGADAHRFGYGTREATKQEQMVHNYLASLSSDPRVRADQWPVTGQVGPKTWAWTMRRARNKLLGR